MTLEEKAGLCSGKDFWTLKSVERLGLTPVKVSDGPHGLRKQPGEIDDIAPGTSVPATCFPTACATACSFDRDLLQQIGAAMGEECRQEQVSVILGPGVNIKRSPLCGRNFEYFSEDPMLAGEMAASLIAGVQSQGVGTSLKHFAGNNQETRRMTVSAVIDERALREIYLAAFERAVKRAEPWTVMCSYNRLNGTYASENERLLTTILRDEWGYEGLVMSDWGAVNDRVKGVAAGLDLEMPGSNGVNDARIVEAVKAGQLPEEVVDQAACRVTELILRAQDNLRPGFTYDKTAHHALAVKAAEESAVLLKNVGGLLPGNPGQTAAVIGAFAKQPRYQGAGSSLINPLQLNCAWDALVASGIDAKYAEGYLMKGDKPDEALIEEACRVAKGKDIVYIFAGLPAAYESEGFDRGTLAMPESHNRLIEAVADVNANTVVILSGGAPMELPWEDQVKVILLCYLGGEGGGTAAANLLLGKAVPSGKLAETWPLAVDDTPSYKYFPGGRATVEYRESIYVGYRYYEKAEKPVQYPFGFGLSYSSFEYSGLRLDKNTIQYGETVTVTFAVKNTGSVRAKEAAQVYVAHKNAKVFVPLKELKGFAKVELEPGESKEISIEVDARAFSYYNTAIHDWYAESGEYEILVGPSSAECPLRAIITMVSPEREQPDYLNSVPSYYHLPCSLLDIPDKDFAALYGQPLPEMDPEVSRPFGLNNTLADTQGYFIGRTLMRVMKRVARQVAGGDEDMRQGMEVMLTQMPFRSFMTMGGAYLSPGQVLGLLDVLNGRYGRGLRKLMRKGRHDA
jgi:beta-glucosidase